MANTQSSIADRLSSSESSQSSLSNEETTEPLQKSSQQPEQPEPENPMHEHLRIWVKRWQFHDALTRWAVFVIELTLNHSPAHPEEIFTRGPVPAVHDRSELARCFHNHEISKDEINWCIHGQWDDDQVQVCIIYGDMVLHHQGIYHPGAPEPNPDGRLIHVAPKHYKAFCETLAMFYRPYMWSALQMNDPGLTDQYVEITMHRTYGLWSHRLIQTPASHRHNESHGYNHANAHQRQARKLNGEAEEEVLCENADVLGDQMLRSIMVPFQLGELTQDVKEKLQIKFPDAFPLVKK